MSFLNTNSALEKVDEKEGAFMDQVSILLQLQNDTQDINLHSLCKQNCLFWMARSIFDLPT